MQIQDFTWGGGRGGGHPRYAKQSKARKVYDISAEKCRNYLKSQSISYKWKFSF